MKDQIQESYSAYTALRTEMDQWLQQSRRLDPPGPNDGGEDEANYALAWFPHYLVTGDQAVLRHFEALKAALKGWVERECLHGYEPEAEAHHGPEPFLLFLPRYIGLQPRDSEAVSLLADAAEHIGNWVPEIPPWYDDSRDTFVGYRIGTRCVTNDDREAFELAEHFRFLHIALAAHRVTGAERYLEWALRHGRKRAGRLVAAPEPMPLLWTLDGKGLDEAEVDARGLHGIAASAHHLPGDRLAGIENLLASGAVYALGDLWLLSGEEVFREAARRIVEPLVTSLDDPCNDPAAAALSYYRWTFADTGLDAEIRSGLEALPESPPERLALVFPEERRIRAPGVGKRADMAFWGEWSEDGSVKPVREPSTATLTLSWQVTGEIGYALRALRGAATRLQMARRVLRGGREHADMGGAVCSVAAGHGRNWGQGAVTACYGPLLLGTREIQGEVRPLMEFRRDDGRSHPPPTLLSLVRPLPGEQSAAEAISSSASIPSRRAASTRTASGTTRRSTMVVFHNGGETQLAFSWRIPGDGEESPWRQERLAPGSTCERSG